jgi:hypothetical protein
MEGKIEQQGFVIIVLVLNTEDREGRHRIHRT